MHDREVARIRRAYVEHDASATVQVRRDAENPGNQMIIAERVAATRSVLQARGLLPLTDAKILDVGCGRGSLLASLRELGARDENLHGVDLLPDRIDDARRVHPAMRFACTNAEHLDFADGSIDLVVAFTVFSSILDDGMAANVAGEITRVLTPGGAVLWYDFRIKHPLNRHTRAMGRNAVTALFPACRTHLRPITLVPPLARRLGAGTRGLYPALARIPLLRSHLLGVLVKEPS